MQLRVYRNDCLEHSFKFFFCALANAVWKTACSITSSELGEEILKAYIATTKIIAFENKLQYVLAK